MINRIINEYPELIKYYGIIKNNNSFMSIYCKKRDICESIILYSFYEKHRWLEAEPILIEIQNPEELYWYARDAIKRRWPEAEPYIMKNPKWAYYYTKDVIKQRWSEAEPYIIKSMWAKSYNHYFGTDLREA